MDLFKETYHNAKVTNIEGKIPIITGLATTAALKTDYDAKIPDFESKYFTTSDYNKFTS